MAFGVVHCQGRFGTFVSNSPSQFHFTKENILVGEGSHRRFPQLRIHRQDIGGEEHCGADVFGLEVGELG